MEFSVRDLLDRRGEPDGSGGLFHLAAEITGQAVELRGSEFLDVAGGELGLHFLELLSEVVESLGDGAEPFIGKSFQFDGPEVLDLELMFAAPSNEGGPGDIQLGGEPREGPTLRAELDKPLDRFFVVHLTFRGLLVPFQMAGAELGRSGAEQSVF